MQDGGEVGARAEREEDKNVSKAGEEAAEDEMHAETHGADEDEDCGGGHGGHERERDAQQRKAGVFLRSVRPVRSECDASKVERDGDELRQGEWIVQEDGREDGGDRGRCIQYRHYDADR